MDGERQTIFTSRQEKLLKFKTLTDENMLD